MGIEYKTDCPIRAVLKVLGGKWPLLVLSKLEESKRFSAIKREIPEISEKKHGIAVGVEEDVVSQVPRYRKGGQM